DAEAALQQERSTERPLHRHLLVEEHPDQDRERLLREQAVGLRIGGEEEGLGPGHAPGRGGGVGTGGHGSDVTGPIGDTGPIASGSSIGSNPPGTKLLSPLNAPACAIPRGRLPDRPHTDPELAAEQAYVDSAYARLEAMRDAAERVREAYADVRAG